MKPKTNKQQAPLPVGSGDLLGCMVESLKYLRQLRRLCESTARSGKYVREMQAYKNALATERLIESTVEKVAKIRRNLDASRQTNQVKETVSLVVCVINGDRQQNRAAANRARSIIGVLANI
jgi:hypothetical protein